jgi:4-amino-4-deoxy-L-arabinose transferase-like glycosyltransferase
VRTNQRILLVIILSVGIALRAYFLFNYELIDAKEHVIFLSDEGIVGLMAKHIASGTDFPLFFYGQNYLGAFEAYVAALLFSVFGVSNFTLKVVPVIFSVILLFVVYLLGKRLFNPWVGVVSALLVAVPSPYFFAWGFKARGGFIEHVVFSVLIFFVFSLIYFHRKSSFWLYALLGFLSGITLWINQLVILYLAILGILLWLKRRVLLDKAKLVTLVLPFLLGASPLILANIQEPFGTAKTLLLKQFKVKRDIGRYDNSTKIIKFIKGSSARLKQILPETLQSLSILFGKEQTWIDESEIPQTTRIENLPGVPRFFWLVIPLFFGCALLAGCYRKIRVTILSLVRGKCLSCMKDLDKMDLLLLLFGVSLLTYFSPRFLLVCYPLAAIVAAAFFDNLRGVYVKALYAALLVGTISLNAYGIVDLALNQRDGSIAKLITTLEAKGCNYGYSTGPMYQIAFLSLERTIFVPIDSKSRYPDHEIEVGKASRVCYVFIPDQVLEKNHRAFTKLLEQEKIGYQQIITVNSDTNYHIYHSLAPRQRIQPNVREKLKIIRRNLSQRVLDVPTRKDLPDSL